MNVKDFEYIVEIADQKSISKAASRLYVSQPSLTKYLQRMERELQTPLFHRMGKQLIPTPAGQCFIEKARSVLILNEQIIGEIQSINTHQHGNIYLGLPSSRGAFIISSVLPEFRKAFPFIQVFMDFDGTATLIQNLEIGQYDMLLINYTQEKKSLCYQKVGEDEMVLAVPPDSPLIDKAVHKEGKKFPFIGTEFWKNEPFILAQESLRSGQYAIKLFSKLEISPPVALKIRDISKIMLAVQHRIGNAIIPSFPQEGLSPDSRLIYLSIEDDEAPVKIAAVTQKGKNLSEPEKHMITLMAQRYQPL